MSTVSLYPMAATPTSTTAAATGTGTSSSSSSSQTSLSSLGITFMKLLVQEMQNQDPTAPMDTTQMVGQMISLNQLDQVASINQLLTSTLGAAAGSASSSAKSGTSTPGVTGS